MRRTYIYLYQGKRCRISGSVGTRLVAISGRVEVSWCSIYEEIDIDRSTRRRDAVIRRVCRLVLCSFILLVMHHLRKVGYTLRRQDFGDFKEIKILEVVKVLTWFINNDVE